MSHGEHLKNGSGYGGLSEPWASERRSFCAGEDGEV